MNKLLLSLGVSLALATSLSAQLIPCVLGDDGFNLGCCNIPQPNLPPLPPSQFQANYGAFNNCGLLAQQVAGVTITAPAYFQCDYAIANMTATMAPGVTITGPLLMKYARTWTEIDPGTGMAAQVWRFLLNTDATYIAAGPVGALFPVPVSAQPPLSLPVHFNGHVDYICNPTAVAPTRLLTFSLNHLPACISHAPWSARPLPVGAVPAAASYHLVGPMPFVFGPFAEPQGPVVEESLRTSRFNLAPFNYQCVTEASVIQGNLNTVLQNCLCAPIAPVVGPWKHQNLNLSVCCGPVATGASSIPVPGTPIAPTGFVAMTLGTFPSPVTTVPGRNLTIYFGVVQYADPCNAANWPIHVVCGVATSQVPGRIFPGPVAAACAPFFAAPLNTFLDLQNSLPITGGPLVPGYGALFGSDLVMNLNIP